MIIFANEKHKGQIATLWSKAFGDKESDVLKYLDSILKFMLIYEEDDIVLGMLALLPVKLCGKCGRYIYAVATREDKRGRGISTGLLEFAKNHIKENNETFLVLVPQNESLFSFYEKRGFSSVSCIERRQDYAECPEIKGGIVKRITAEDYKKIREIFFCGTAFVEWDTNMLAFAKSMYDGEFVSVIVDGKEIGAAFCFVVGEELFVREMLAQKPELVVKILKKEYGISKATYVCPNLFGEPFAMFYPEVKEYTYFNIALD